MQQTTKYQFNLIEGGDDFSPNPLNENMEKVEGQLNALDTALAGVSQEVTTITSFLSSGQNCKIAFGQYTGTGSAGAAQPNTLTFDFTPVMVMVSAAVSSSTVGIILAGQTQGNLSGYIDQIFWSDNSVGWYNASSNADRQYNTSGTVYRYIAIGY